MNLEDLLRYRLPSMPRLSNGNRIVAFSIPQEVFDRIETELVSVKSIYEGQRKDMEKKDGTSL